MLNSVFLWLAKVWGGKYLVSALAWVHNLADGKKSEILLGVLALIHGLKISGVIPADVAEGIEKTLLPLLPVVLADRASKIKETIDKVVP